MNRTTRRMSGLELDEVEELKAIKWTYDSAILGPISGTLEYRSGGVSGWTIEGLPPVPPDHVTFWLLPMGLIEAVEKIEEQIAKAESVAAQPTPEEQQVKAELDELFGHRVG